MGYPGRDGREAKAEGKPAIGQKPAVGSAEDGDLRIPNMKGLESAR